MIVKIKDDVEQQEIQQHQQSQPLAPTCSLANFEHLHRHWQQQEIQQQEIQQHQQSQPLAAASAEAAPNIGIAAAGRTTEVLGLVLQRGQGLVAVCDSNERKGLVAVSKTMNREVRRAIMMSDAAFNRRYPEIKSHFSFVPQYII